MATTRTKPTPILRAPESLDYRREQSHRPSWERPQLSVVIVNYARWDDTVRLVRQLRSTEKVRRGHVDILVVDNHSPPHPLIRKLRRAQGVSLRRWARNRGFSRAVNEGCRLSQGSWILLLNPDVTLSEGFVDGVLALIERLESTEPRAGVVGFRLHNSDGSSQLSAGRFPSLLGTLGGQFLPRARRKYRHVVAPRRCRVEWVTGCCLLVRRDCLRDLGGFDEDYFLYYEDVDFCHRAHRHGWSVWYEPALSAIHHWPLHARTVPAPLRLCTRHGLLAYAAKHWGTIPFYVLAGIVRLESWLRQKRALDAEGRRPWRQLDVLVAELRAGQFAAARRRVDRIMRRWVPSMNAV